MKRTPIIMQAESVRAILEGRKTQTRRVMKPQPEESEGMNCRRLTFFRKDGQPLLDESIDPICEPSLFPSLCPYGTPGDRLWVRETFGYDCMAGADECSHVNCIHYRADITDARAIESWRGKWKPSIFMPRSASRITLEITDVRVQRLQDISEADCIAEGCPAIRRYVGSSLFDLTPLGHYCTVFEEINGVGSWAKNEWVWALTFKRVVA